MMLDKTLKYFKELQVKMDKIDSNVPIHNSSAFISKPKAINNNSLSQSSDNQTFSQYENQILALEN